MDMEERISCRAASMYSCNQDFVCDIDSLIIDPLLSVNFRTMCPKTLGSGEWDSAQALWKLGPPGSPTSSING